MFPPIALSRHLAAIVLLDETNDSWNFANFANEDGRTVTNVLIFITCSFANPIKDSPLAARMIGLERSSKSFAFTCNMKLITGLVCKTGLK